MDVMQMRSVIAEVAELTGSGLAGIDATDVVVGGTGAGTPGIAMSSRVGLRSLCNGSSIVAGVDCTARYGAARPLSAG